MVADALSQSLLVYAQDAPLAEACAPLLSHIERQCPEWSAGLIQIHGAAAGAFRASFVCGPNVTAAEAQILCDAVDHKSVRDPPHALTFETATLDGAPPAALARLLISDDHAVGVLALLWREEVDVAAPPAITPSLQTIARVLALMLEDRQSIAGLAQQEAVLRTVLETAPDAIIRISADGVIRSFNRSAERMFGYAEHEAVGKPITMIMTADYAARHQGYIDRYLHTGDRRLENWCRRFPAVCKNGFEMVVELAISELTVDRDPHFVGVIRDVTDRLREQERRNRLNQTLEHTAQLSALGEMAATIAHEVNQPLTAIANFLDAAQKLAEKGDPADRDKMLGYLAQARSQAQVGGDIIKRVRRMTMRRPPDWEDTDLNGLVRDVLGYLECNAQAQGAALSVALTDPTPFARVDRVQIQQVIANLVRNAIDAVSGRKDSVITVQTQQDDADVEICVSDNGPGVPFDQRDAVFDSFFTTRDEGVGLGLSVSRSIAQAHGGTLTVGESDLGGACFQLRLPRKQA